MVNLLKPFELAVVDIQNVAVGMQVRRKRSVLTRRLACCKRHL
jgi:hypothetical protein